MIKLKELITEETIKCPVSTQNADVNAKHRQIAIDNYGYGPNNPNNPNVKFWKDKAMTWKLSTMEEAKESRCNSCAYFNVTSRINKCIEHGAAPAPASEPPVTEGEDVTTAPAPETDDTQGAEASSWDTIEAGKLGYCTMFKFKAAGSRTCNHWAAGGPIKDK